MRCLYEVLEVERSADEAELKKGYRKQALKWHPDKNAHQAEEANEIFQEIQNAWEVLSDPQERAWYDSHREQILNSGGRHQAGGSSDAGAGQCPDDPLNFASYKAKGFYKGYTDAPNGFFRVFETLFSIIAAQERAAYERQKGYTEKMLPPDEAPLFGSSHAPEADVKAFYSFWVNFQSVKDFSWEDVHNPASAPSRKIRRLMEDENTKRRKAAKLAFVANVRELAEHVKLKDVRMLRFQKERAERRALAQAEEDKRRRAEREAKRAAALAYQPADWVTAGDDEEAETAHEQQDEEKEMFECIVCDKYYKTEKALQNHHNSKKHKEQLKKFKKMMTDEDKLDLLDDLSLGANSKCVPTAEEARPDDAQSATAAVQSVGVPAGKHDASAAADAEEQPE